MTMISPSEIPGRVSPSKVGSTKARELSCPGKFSWWMVIEK
jgi:hypothetical protein